MKNQGLIAAAVIGGLILLSRRAGATGGMLSQAELQAYANQMNTANTLDQLGAINTEIQNEHNAGRMTNQEYQSLRELYDSLVNAFIPVGLPTYEHMKACYLKRTADRPECADLDYDGDGIVNAVDWGVWVGKVGASV